MGNSLLENLFIGVMVPSICWCITVAFKFYILNKYSGDKALKILYVSLPERKRRLPLNDFRNYQNNKSLLKLFYYGLVFVEMSTHLFVFITICLFFFGLIPIFTKAIQYDDTTLYLLLFIDIIVVGMCWFSRAFSKHIAIESGVDLTKLL